MTNTNRHNVRLPQASASFLFSLPFDAEDGTFSVLHGITTQKAAHFTVTAVRTSNPTQLSACFCWFVALITARPWRWRQYVVPKRRTVPELHGFATQNTAFFMKRLTSRVMIILRCPASSCDVLIGSTTTTPNFGHI
jgi:hypothetical protein